MHGIKRSASLFNTARVDHIYQNPHTTDQNFKLHYGVLTDASHVTRILREVEPHVVYNLGPMSLSVSRRPNTPPTWMPSAPSA